METTQPTSQEGGPTADPAVEASPWQLLLLLFGEIWSIQTLEQKSKCRIEKIEAQPVDLKIGFCTICNKTQPVATAPGKGKGQWEERGAEDSSGRLTLCLLLLLVWLHADSWLSTWGPVAQSMFSIFLWLSETDLGALPDLGVNTVFLHPLPLLPKQRGGVWSALCWPSGKLQQTHLIQAEITGRPRRACVDESLRFKCCQMPAIHLTKSEQSLTASSKRH